MGLLHAGHEGMARHLGDRRHHRGRQPVLAQPVGGPGDLLLDLPQQAAAPGLMRILGVVPVVPRHGDSPLSAVPTGVKSEEHTSALQSLMRLSYAVFRSTKKNKKTTTHKHHKRRTSRKI